MPRRLRGGGHPGKRQAGESWAAPGSSLRKPVCQGQVRAGDSLLAAPPENTSDPHRWARRREIPSSFLGWSTGPGGVTNEVPAPVSNQVITFKDIDDKPPLEFIVQGMKGSNLGYAIYRVEGSILENLFGEGMEDCC